MFPWASGSTEVADKVSSCEKGFLMRFMQGLSLTLEFYMGLPRTLPARLI